MARDQVVPQRAPVRIVGVHPQRVDERRLHDEALAPVRQQVGRAVGIEHRHGFAVVREPLVEQDAGLVERLQQLCQRLKASTVQVRRGDGLAALQQSAPASLDLVLLAPPFESPHYEAALKAAARALGPQGFVYLEAATAWNDEALAPLGLALHRHLKAGAVHAHLLRAVEG